ncbi:sigma-54 dependent transcriptional regulator [Aliamphritea spongicola]|uniref:sigma-54 dependent transcriptional regulator n=1 Tax=Aliamphritea spongicola TaxID=707589 RepID=UPI00196B2587|nr:sigma-54 dependent transcriptional regulator [Aliamphritea spongicola]MBN3563503.1 sigma-54-dependent Fis family transcriptional regulator [Aliamphritea spongicola]
MQLLYVDDNADSRRQLSDRLTFAGIACQTESYVDWLQAEEGRSSEYLAVMLGHCNHPIDLEKLLAQRLDEATPVITVGDWMQPEAASEGLQQRILGTLTPGSQLSDVQYVLHRAQIFRGLRQPAELAGGLQQAFADLAGGSAVMNDVRSLMAQVAGRDVSVLINGESGTGKEVVANCLHKASSRAAGPFVPLNCGAIPSELLESELFGHEKGAFTGAVSSRPGRFELADGGTLFLDEIGDMPLNMQVKLLRVIQEKCFERVGGTKTIDCDVRIIAATHKNLEEMIDEGKFREDLYYRLNVFPIAMPALRERTEDIPTLTELFVRRAEADGFGRIKVMPAVIRSLQQHPWSGNVRELANLIERLTIMHPDSIISISELPEKFRYLEEDAGDISLKAQLHLDVDQAQAEASDAPGAHVLPEEGIDMKAYLEGIEQVLIEQALDTTNNVVARAADKLQIRRTTLVEKMRKYGIQRK